MGCGMGKHFKKKSSPKYIFPMLFREWKGGRKGGGEEEKERKREKDREKSLM